MERQDHFQNLNNHVIICNCSEKVKNIVEELHKGTAGNPMDALLIVQDRKLWENNPYWHPVEHNPEHFHIFYGRPSEETCLNQVNLNSARAAIILADPRQGKLADARSTLVALAIEHHSTHVHTVIELVSSSSRVHLRTTKIDEVICLGEITCKLIAQSCITPGIKNLFERLLQTGPETNQIFLPTLPIELEDQTFRELFKNAVRNNVPYIICGYILNGRHPSFEHHPPILSEMDETPLDQLPQRRKRTVVLNPRTKIKPGKDTLLKAGDQLIVIAHEIPDLKSSLNSVSYKPE